MTTRAFSFLLKLAVFGFVALATSSPAVAKSAKKVAAAKAPITPEQNDAMADALAKGDAAKAKQLHKKGVSYDAFGSDEMTGLMHQADDGDEKSVNATLAMGANINAKNANNESALWYAVYSGHEKLALNLIKKGASPEGQRPDSKECLMHMAAQGGLAELAVKLMKLTPKCVSQKDVDGRTPAEDAKSLGYTKLAKALTPKK